MPLRRSLAILAGGLALLILIGVTVTVIASRQAEATFPADSAPGTVATYLRLLQDGQIDDAYALTAFPDSREGPRSPATREGFHQQMDRWSQQPHRVLLVRSNTNGAQATVVVEVSTFIPDVFGASDRTIQQTFTLERRAGAWRITGPVYLYP